MYTLHSRQSRYNSALNACEKKLSPGRIHIYLANKACYLNGNEYIIDLSCYLQAWSVEKVCLNFRTLFWNGILL